jgi:heme/copper-type cytochrome/quinol oxidase subunit 4
MGQAKRQVKGRSKNVVFFNCFCFAIMGVLCKYIFFIHLKIKHNKIWKNAIIRQQQEIEVLW